MNDDEDADDENDDDENVDNVYKKCSCMEICYTDEVWRNEDGRGKMAVM